MKPEKITQLDKAKDWAKRSGYPFENEVYSSIKNSFGEDADIIREIEFHTINEAGDPCIRSLDFACKLTKHSQNIPDVSWPRGDAERIEVNFLIDAKYMTDDHYLFMPSFSSRKHFWPYLIPTVTELGRTLIERPIYRRDLVEFSQVGFIPVASNGRRISEQTRERDSVSSATLQVVQGLINFFQIQAEQLGKTNEQDPHYTRNVHYFIPIVVTNNPLYLLRKDIDLATLSRAQDESEFFQIHELICLEIPKIYDLKIAWENARLILNKSKKLNLSWVGSGLGDGLILFATLKGLQSFLSDMKCRFEQLKPNPETPQ